MPFSYDSHSQLFVAASGSAVRALRVDPINRSAIVVKDYLGHNTTVNDVLISFHVLLTCSTELICHNFGTGHVKWRLLKGCKRDVAKLAVLGDTLVCCMADCSVAIVNVRLGTMLYYTELKGERAGGIPYVAIDPFNRLAYVNANRSVNGWSLAIGRRVFNTDLVLGQIYSSASSSVYKILYGGAGDGAVRAYKVPTGETLWTALGHTENVNSMVASEHLEFVISGSADGSLRAWDIRNGTPRWSVLVFLDKAAITHLVCAEWENVLVVGGEQGLCVAYNAKEGTPLWVGRPARFGFASITVVTSTELPGILKRFSSGYMLLCEYTDGTVEVRNLKSGEVQWSWEPPLVFSNLVAVRSIPSPLGDGRACIGKIRTIVGRTDDGTIRTVSAHNGSTLWRSSGGGGNAITHAVATVNGKGMVAYGTDAGSIFALDEMTGLRIWKIAGFKGQVVHVLSTAVYTVTPSKSVACMHVLLTWSDDNVLRAWNFESAERLWSRHAVAADVGVCHIPGSLYVVCVGRYDVTSVLMENGNVMVHVPDIGVELVPIVSCSFGANVARSRSQDKDTASRRQSARSSVHSSSVRPFDEELPLVGSSPVAADQLLGEEAPSAVPLAAGDVGAAEALAAGAGANVPGLNLSQVQSQAKQASRQAMVACIVSSGDMFVINMETGDIGCAISFPWVDEGDGLLGHVKPENHAPVVALYEGVGMLGTSQKPMVIAALGEGDGAFMGAWRVYDDNRSVWEIQAPTAGITFMRCIGKRLWCGTLEGLTVMDAVTGRIEWKFNPFREAMVSCSLVVSPNPPKPRRGGGWALYDDEVKAVVFGSSPGGMFALSTKNRESKVGDVVFLQLSACDETSLMADEVPELPEYHPPGSGGISGLLRMEHDALRWNTHKWVHTSATKLHQYLPLIDYTVELLLWVLAMFQLTYFPLRASFPPVMLLWTTLSTSIATFGISRMSGEDSFQPAYLKSLVLLMATMLLVSTQAWIMEWRLRYPESKFRNTVVALLHLFSRFSYMVLFVPITRMVIAPFVCNVASLKVAVQMVHAQDYFLEAFAPVFFKADPPDASAIAMGRDVKCKGGVYFTFFAVSIVVSLLHFPLMCRLVAVRGKFTLLRFSAQLRSSVGWWRDDDSRSVLDVVQGRTHGFCVKNRFVALTLLVLLRTALMGIAEANLAPAAEFFLVLVLTGFMHFILTLRPLFHDAFACVLVKSMSSIVVLLSALAWFSAVYVRPIGPRGLARDAFVTFLVIVGVPGVFVAVMLEEKLRTLCMKHIRCCRGQRKALSGRRGTSSRKKSVVSQGTGDESEYD